MRKLYRNIAFVTAVFMLALTAMLCVSYYQMRQVSPLESEVMETLKELNESNGGGEALQQQIRELDLLSRKAYFVKEGQLKMGIYLLLGMALVLVACLNLYYKETKNLPEKDFDPIDDWMTKSLARRYLSWTAVGATAVALALVALQHVDLSKKTSGTEEPATAEVGGVGQGTVADEDSVLAISSDTLGTDTLTLLAAADSLEAEEATDSLPELKIASKAFRGNNSSGTSSARGIATSWNLSSKKNILWQSKIPKHGYNSPVITGRNVFITGADDQARELYCYDVWTGELKWTLKADGIAGSPSAMPQVNDDTGLAASTVATNGEQVAAIFATGDVICADMEGKRLWAKNIGLPDNHYGYASSLLMYGLRRYNGASVLEHPRTKQGGFSQTTLFLHFTFFTFWNSRIKNRGPLHSEPRLQFD